MSYLRNFWLIQYHKDFLWGFLLEVLQVLQIDLWFIWVVNFYIWYKEGFQKFVLLCGVCVFGVWVSSCSCTICCNTCHFSTELPLHHYQKLIHHLCVGQFLDFLFCSVDLFVCVDGQYCSFLFSVAFIISLEAGSASHLTFFSGYVLRLPREIREPANAEYI